MSKEKYYAVKVGKVSGIYTIWEQCKEQVNGVSGAQYKSFSTLTEAEQYMLNTAEISHDVKEELHVNSSEDINIQVEDRIRLLSEKEVIAFVDGSYDVTEEKSAFGAIIFDNNRNKEILYKAFTKQLSDEFIALRNVAAELEGVKEAINWAIKYKKRKIVIYYDYEGIEKWATGLWKAQKSITQEYLKFIQEKKAILEIEFIKVPAHSGIKYNEEVDAVAKNALLSNGYKTYNDGSVYFVGYSLDDWESIIEYINEENAALEVKISSVQLSVETIGTREKIVALQSSNRVVINCYKNSKSYVQGKQTVLFQKVISTAIEMLGTKQSVIETLNSYHALTLTADEVENKFEQLLPHYRKETKKHYSNLLSAVYNVMLTGYMPDYTCLVTPIFRAYEYYLHRILGDVMGLTTETDKGANNFAFFNKNDKGLFECNSNNKGLLLLDQLKYLNLLYTRYNSVRHPYSHWSLSDEDTAVITDIATARQLVLDGLKLIDEYYLFF